ncbi:MAG: hypothetical protein LBI15_03055 [Dysgonamonadaceae bacterium]|jgi:hypothetical protein|nr:hypothetical protein [Dysgonamonadaceae bacterium]
MKKVYVAATLGDYHLNFENSIDGMYENVAKAIESAEKNWHRDRYSKRTCREVLYFGTIVYEFNVNDYPIKEPTILWYKNIDVEKFLRHHPCDAEIEIWLKTLNDVIEYSATIQPSYFKDRSVIKKHLGDMEGAEKDLKMYKQLIKKQ